MLIEYIIVTAIVLGAAVGLITWFLVAKEFEDIAEMKGHYGKPYFWWTLLLGIIGMLMVIALPYVKKDEDRTAEYTSNVAN